MALIGNYTWANKNLGRQYAGTTTAGASASQTKGNWQKNGAMVNIALQSGTTAALPLISFPLSYGGKGWKLPINFTLLQRSTPGTSALTISTSGTAGLIAGGTGTAGLTINGTGAVVATILGEGTATLTVSGSGVMEASGFATASATLTVSGSAAPVGRGQMEGTTDYSTELSPAAIAVQVRIEEKAMRTAHGDAYEHYATHVGRWFGRRRIHPCT
jgi:hypothetical protein